MAIQQIGDILLKKKVITKETLEYALSIQESLGKREKLGRILKDNNFVEDEDIAKALAEQSGWKYFNKKYVVSLPEVQRIGLDILMDRVCVPVETDKGTAFVFAYPFDVETSDSLVHGSSSGGEFYVGSESAILANLERIATKEKGKEIDRVIDSLKEKGLTGDELKELLCRLIDEAIIQNATDIHIEPQEKVSTIRFRIDGVLCFKRSIPIEMHNNLVNVVFSRAEITVSEFYKFHDARFSHTCLNHTVDIRVSGIPSIFGPCLVLRLLDITKTLINLENLGFYNTHLEAISRTIGRAIINDDLLPTGICLAKNTLDALSYKLIMVICWGYYRDLWTTDHDISSKVLALRNFLHSPASSSHCIFSCPFYRVLESNVTANHLVFQFN